MKVKLSGHTAYYTQYHITWITKYRRRILNPGVVSYLIKLFPKIIKSIKKYIKFQQSQDSGQAQLVLE